MTSLRPSSSIWLTPCSAACEGVGAAAIDLIQESFLINPRAIVSALMNDLADVDDEVYLFLEDYHWVTNPAIHEALTFFAQTCSISLPRGAHHPDRALRAQNQLLEIDAAYDLICRKREVFSRSRAPARSFLPT